MNADTLKAALDAFGPGVIAIAVLIFFILKRQPTPPSNASAGFDAESKLYLKEHITEPILKALSD